MLIGETKGLFNKHDVDLSHFINGQQHLRKQFIIDVIKRNEHLVKFKKINVKMPDDFVEEYIAKLDMHSLYLNDNLSNDIVLKYGYKLNIKTKNYHREY